GHDPWIQHAARHELELEDVAVHDDRVAGVVAALVADTERGLFGEVVGELALALVTPLGADDHRAGHAGLTTVATAITLTRSYYPAGAVALAFRAARYTARTASDLRISSRISPMNPAVRLVGDRGDREVEAGEDREEARHPEQLLGDHEVPAPELEARQHVRRRVDEPARNWLGDDEDTEYQQEHKDHRRDEDNLQPLAEQEHER